MKTFQEFNKPKQINEGSVIDRGFSDAINKIEIASHNLSPTSTVAKQAIAIDAGFAKDFKDINTRLHGIVIDLESLLTDIQMAEEGESNGT